MKFAKIAVELNIDRCFTYSVPECLEDAVVPGIRVRVPFGRRQITGYVLGSDKEPPGGARMIVSAVDAFPPLTPGLIELAEWISGYYLCGLGEAMKCMMPGRAGFKKDERGDIPAGAPERSARFPEWAAELGKSVCGRRHRVYYLKAREGDSAYRAYLGMSEAVLGMGRQVVILAPDMVSLGKMAVMFESGFKGKTGVYHGGLPAGRKRELWTEALSGKAGVILGLRSAVFAPLKNPGLIIVDREYDFAYKQKRTPRYNAAEAARKRGVIEGAPVVLQGACPSLETGWKLRTEQYDYIEPGGPAGVPAAPAVRVVDMRSEKSGIISRELRNEVREALVKGKRAVLFMDRRGYSRYMFCRNCGYVPRCGNCSVAMKYHRDVNRLICHYCKHSENIREMCPECDGGYLKKGGFGTQQVESAVSRIFPEARVARVDSDAGAVKDGDIKLVDEFQRGEKDILVATSMALKFGAFQNVALAGIVSAESFLNLPDFRAAENLFRFACRVRESINGRFSLILQTYNPESHAVRHILNFDAEGFFTEESIARKKLRYPPFGHLANIIVSSENDSNARECSEWLAGLLREKMTAGTEVLGPVPAAVTKMRMRHRWQIVLKCRDWQESAWTLRGALGEAQGMCKAKKARMAVDVDAIDMM